jgi:hypothetical protein
MFLSVAAGYPAVFLFPVWIAAAQLPLFRLTAPNGATAPRFSGFTRFPHYAFNGGCSLRNLAISAINWSRRFINA